MVRRSFIPFLLATLLAVFPLVPAVPAGATEFNVGVEADLAAAVTAAQPGDTIKLSNDITGSGATYTISASGVILDGGGHTLTGGAATSGPLFTFSANAAVNNLTIQGMTNNGGRGGAVLLANKSMTMSNVVFSGNSAHAPTSTGDYGGGALRLESSGSCDFSGTKFFNNAVRLNPAVGNSGIGSGGATYIRASRNISFEGSLFSGNYAGNMGGAVFAAFNSGNLNFDQAEFHNNTSEFEGGAVSLWTLNDATFKNAVFNGNESKEGYGGAIYLNDTFRIDFTGASFVNNKANALEGGAVSIRNGGDLVFRDVLFQGNQSLYGGAVSLWNNSGTPTTGMDFTGSVFKDNHATFDGGALNLPVRNLRGVVLNNVTFTGNTAAQGGAIYSESDLVIGGNSLFSGNTARREGGAINLWYADLTLNPGAGQTVNFATATDTIEGRGNLIKTGAGKAEFHGKLNLEDDSASPTKGNVEVRQGEMVLANDATITANNFTLNTGATLGLTLSAANNARIRLDTANGGTGLMEGGSTVRAQLTGDAAALKAGESMDVAVLTGAIHSAADSFKPTIAILNSLFSATGKFEGDTWYITISRAAAPDLPPEIGDIVDDDYKPGENPWLDDAYESEDPARAVLSGMNLPGLVQTFFIVQDISGIMRNASAQGPNWARQRGGKVWGDERGVLWAAPLFLHDEAYKLSSRQGLKSGYNLNLGGGMAGLNRNAADNTVTMGGLVAVGAGRLTSNGELLPSSNTTQFVAGSLHGEWRPAAFDGALKLGAQAGIISTENSAHQRGPSTLKADIYAKAWQFDLYAERSKVIANWELSARIGAGVVWYHRPTFNAKAVRQPTAPGESPREVDVAEYTTSRETTVRLPVQVKARRRFQVGEGTVTPEVYVGYQPVLGDRSEDYRWKLIPGTRQAKIYGPRLDRHNALAGAAIVWEKENSRVALSWDTELSAHRNSHAVGLTFSLSF